jgi:uncharacterized protein YceK
MTRRSLWRWIAVGVLAALSGCSTMENLQSPYDPATRTGGCQVYGGTRMALKESGRAVSCIGKDGEAGVAGLLTPLYLADVPLSAAADTVTLPVTVPESLQRQSAAQGDLSPTLTPGSSSARRDGSAYGPLRP